MQLFTPLDKQYCIYFYFMSVFSFITFSIILFIGIISLFYSLFLLKQKINIVFYVNVLSLIISSFMAYLVNRLMYSMCIKTL